MKLEVGKTYGCASGYPPITIVKRTAKTVTVTNNKGRSFWRMRIRIDQDGNEYVTDCSVPKSWRDTFTYSAKREEEEWFA